MGQSVAKYSVISLNYSGILLSPFEFYSNENQQQQKALSDVFRKLLKETTPNFNPNTFAWKLGKIDQKIQKERYSPIYNESVGIVNGKLIDEPTFKSLWNNTFDSNIIAFKDSLVYTEQERQQALQFDLLCYKTIVAYTSNVTDCNEILHNVQLRNVEAYQQLMRESFAKAFLDDRKKIEKIINALHKEQVDIAFVQQTNQSLIKALEETKRYEVIGSQGSESIIVVNRFTFQQKQYDSSAAFEAIQSNFAKELNWNNDTTIALFKNFILISAHLSSKKEKNPIQVQQLWRNLHRLSVIYPQLNIIVGIDANTYLQSQLANFRCYPNSPTEYTTYKKRTWLQPQISKADSLASVCRDHIICNMEFKEEKVTTILNENNKNRILIPTEKHPHDHFVVSLKVQTGRNEA